MMDLKSRLIKLASENPDLRGHILPLVKEAKTPPQSSISRYDGHYDGNTVTLPSIYGKYNPTTAESLASIVDPVYYSSKDGTVNVIDPNGVTDGIDLKVLASTLQDHIIKYAVDEHERAMEMDHGVSPLERKAPGAYKAFSRLRRDLKVTVSRVESPKPGLKIHYSIPVNARTAASAVRGADELAQLIKDVCDEIDGKVRTALIVEDGNVYLRWFITNEPQKFDPFHPEADGIHTIILDEFWDEGMTKSYKSDPNLPLKKGVSDEVDEWEIDEFAEFVITAEQRKELIKGLKGFLESGKPFSGV